MDAFQVLFLLFVLLLMLVGLVGILLPAIPGTVLILVAAVLYVLVEGIDALGWPALVLMGALTLAASTADIWLSGMGAKMGGASGWSLLAGMVCGFAGLLLFSLPGALLGAILGVLIAEVIRVRDWRQALKAGGGWLVGWLLSTVFQLACGLAMVAVFLWRIWPNP